MPLINSFHPDSIPLDQIPATAGQTARLRCYGRDAYSPITVNQLDAGQLQVLLARWTDCTESGKRWAGRIRVTLDQSGKVLASTVYSAEVIKLATVDEPPKQSRRSTKPKAEKAAKPKADAPQFWPGQLVKIPQGARAWVDEILPDGRIAIEIEFVGKDVYPADVLTPIETEPPVSEPELPFAPGQQVRLTADHEQLFGTVGTVLESGIDESLVNTEQLGPIVAFNSDLEAVTVGPDAVELAEDVQPSKARRKRAKTA
jgi:hypothetical protein